MVVAAYVLFEGCFMMITHQIHKFAFLGSYTSRYINNLMYRFLELDLLEPELN